ncbi:class I SAM-dependent methyltransferase [Pseudomonas sp. 5P_3.1_Bac2]|uniref:class I SAM-dependent methyltransferase n=1 Tax=Pseudomonas sp. 5P_3.1_Bac2 TaxID=2971617 RepID=UPI0021C78C9E|nr:class I SAM-dependent methyltransferase [Pseudomonas sp. 5P_3.1_Bac2]MCU1719257.1 class I SAM-dependent methyltransferase [Pseudomonas sp. 5P_3.1_Bac2]
MIKRIIRRLFGTHQAPQEVSIPVDVQEIDTPLSGWFRQESGELFEGFPITPQDTVLDIGCGNGPYANFCASLGAEIIVADIDADKVAAVEALLKDSAARSVTGLVTDAKPIPLKDASVNRVVAMEVLEHVEDPTQFMSELVRVAKPGSLFLLTVPDPVGEQVQKKLAPPVYFEHPNHIRIFQRDEFEQLVIDAGLIIERRTEYGFYWSIWWFFFWACKQDLSPPWHPLLNSWTSTWNMLLRTPDGPRIKKALDEVMPKSQVIVARKP